MNIILHKRQQKKLIKVKLLSQHIAPTKKKNKKSLVIILIPL